MDMTIGKRIGLLRKEKGLTQEELVKLMRVIRQCKCRHRNWVLVEVESAEGDRVLIKP